MVGNGLKTARSASIIAVSGALYAVFFFLSYLIAVPSFTILYLPIILLGVFPVWFGLPGLVGSMIGGVIGGLFVENLGFFAWIELITALIIYGLNWILMPPRAVEDGSKWKFGLLLGVYAGTLFAGTSYILWQFTLLGLLPADVALTLLLPTFALNYIIEIVVCPILLKTMSTRLNSWGVYAGTFLEWRKTRINSKVSEENI